MKWSDQTHYGINCHNVYLYLLFLQFMGKKMKKYMNDWLKPSKTTDVLVNLSMLWMHFIILQTEILAIIVLHYKKFWSFTEIKVDTSHNCTKSESFQGDKISCWKSWLQQTPQTVIGVDSYVTYMSFIPPIRGTIALTCDFERGTLILGLRINVQDDLRNYSLYH